MDVRQQAHLNDGHDTDVRERLDRRGNAVDVALVVGSAAVGVRELAVGGSRSAVTVGKVVDDDLNELLSALGVGVREVILQGVDLGDNIEPGERGDLPSRSACSFGTWHATNLGNLERLRLDGGIADLRCRSGDLACVEGSEPDLRIW